MAAISPRSDVTESMSSSARKAAKYRNDPYRASGRVVFFDEPEMNESALPEGTRHTSLWGRVSFVPYPRDEFRAPTPPPEDADLVRVFIGQLPYFVTDMQLSWLCATFGGGNVVAHPERIMKRQPSGERLPTGCIHAFTTRAAVEQLAAGMHKRMLVDDTGVWHAQTHEEWDVLSRYVAAMKADRRLRVPNRPYDSVVVQLATSTFVPIRPMPITELPAERSKRGGKKARTPDQSPPPEYGAEQGW